MSESIIMKNKRGSGVGCDGVKPVFTMSIKADNELQLSTYHFIATDLAWSETDTTAVTQTVGGDIFMYCTGAQAVSFSVTGMIIYPACESEPEKKFRDFWNTYRIGTYKKLLEVTLDKDVYYVALTNYVRQPTSSEADLDIVKLSFIGVASKNA